MQRDLWYKCKKNSKWPDVPTLAESLRKTLLGSKLFSGSVDRRMLNKNRLPSKTQCNLHLFQPQFGDLSETNTKLAASQELPIDYSTTACQLYLQSYI